MTPKIAPRRWLALACLLACVSSSGCSRFDRRSRNVAQDRVGVESQDDARHAELERELSLYSD